MPPPPFPIEPVRDRYVTPFGGVSSDLASGEVGVDAVALAANTSIAPGRDRVLVSSDLEGRVRPLLLRPLFSVVALGDDRPEASALSPEGQVVFSSEDFGGSRLGLFDALREGAYVVLNATLAARLDPASVFARRRFTRSGE